MRAQGKGMAEGARERGQSFFQSPQAVKTRSTGRALGGGKNRGSRSHDPVLLVGAFGSDSRAKRLHTPLLHLHFCSPFTETTEVRAPPLTGSNTPGDI